MKKILAVRFRIDFTGLCSIGRGKIELLEKIAASGSLSQAARDMEMSYRRAWLLLDSMNTSFDTPVASASTGGHGGGGAVLTDFGQQLITTYRNLETVLTAITAEHMQDVTPRVKTNRTKIAKSTAAKKKRTRVASKSAAVAKRSS